MQQNLALLPPVRADIATPLGTLLVEVHADYLIEAKLVEFVKINNILCRVTCQSHLNMQTESWWHMVATDRVHLLDRVRSGYSIGGSATPSARKKARGIIEPLLEQWIDENAALIESGQQVAERNMIIKAHCRLDAAMSEIADRRASLDQMEAKLSAGSGLTHDERRLLGDLWSHHWRF